MLEARDVYDIFVGTKGVSQEYHLSFDDNKVLKNYQLDIAKSLFKCTGPLTKIYLQEVLTE